MEPEVIFRICQLFSSNQSPRVPWVNFIFPQLFFCVVAALKRTAKLQLPVFGRNTQQESYKSVNFSKPYHGDKIKMNKNLWR